MANVVNTAGSGQEEETTGSTPLSAGGGGALPAEDQDNSAQFSSTSGQTLDVGASAVEAGESQTTSKTAPKASSGMFTNIQKYVEKNKPQAQAMGKAVKQDIEGKASNIRSAVEGAQRKLSDSLKNAQTARTGAQEFAQQQIKGISEGLGRPETVTSSGRRGEATANRNISYMPSEEDASRFQNIFKGDIEGYLAPQAQDISKEVLEARNLGQMTQQAATEQGRQNLLKQTFRKQGDYNKGMSGLDQLIMAGDPSAMQQVADVQEIGQQLVQGGGVDDPNTPYIDESLGIQQVAGNMAGMVGTEQSQLQQALQNIRDQYSKAVTGIETPIQQRLKEAQDFQNMIASEFGEGADLQISKDVADALNLSETSLYGVDPSQFYSNLETPTEASVMRADELARIKALQSLAGKELALGGFDQVGGYDPSQAFDRQAFMDTIRQKEQELRIPEWQAAGEAIDVRDSARNSLIKALEDYDYYGTKGSSSLIDILKQGGSIDEGDIRQRMVGVDSRTLENLSKLLDPYNTAQSTLNNVAKTIKAAGQSGAGNLITGTSAGDLTFQQIMDRKTIQQALDNIKKLQEQKLKIV